MKHELKIWPQYFGRVREGSKTFEVRDNDRGFQPGDLVELKEWDPEAVEREVDLHGKTAHTDKVGYTGETLTFKVGYVLPLDTHRVVFSLLPVETADKPAKDASP